MVLYFFRDFNQLSCRYCWFSSRFPTNDLINLMKIFLCSGFSNIYVISNRLRADKQQIRDQHSEFKMLEVEMAFCDNSDQLPIVSEGLLLPSV